MTMLGEQTISKYLYTFVTLDGQEQMTYLEYFKRPELMALIADAKTFQVIVGRTLFLFPDTVFTDNPAMGRKIMDIKREYEQNRFKYFAPFTERELDFLNDNEHDCLINMGPNRSSKTTGGIIRLLLGREYSAFPMDKNWPIFKDYGVRWRPFREPQEISIATNALSNLQDTIWPQMCRKWIPDKELGLYSMAVAGKKSRNQPSWGHQNQVVLRHKTLLKFYTYEQAQTAAASAKYSGMLWDETPPLFFWKEADARTSTIRDKQHVFSFTPVQEKGRVTETGSRSFVVKMAKGELTMGKKIKVWTTPIHDVPDWIFPETNKTEKYYQYITEPELKGDQRAISEGKARIFGIPDESQGRVYNQWDRKLSVIDPIWKGHPPRDLTLYRAIDHGEGKSPMVCLWLAIDRHVNIFCYRCLFMMGPTIFMFAKEIVRLSGNRLVECLPDFNMDRSMRSSSTMTTHREEYISEGYRDQVMDGRSFARLDTQTGRTLGVLYKANGLKVTGASGQSSKVSAPIINGMMAQNPERVHPVTGKKGAPQYYVFNTCQPHIAEIEGYSYPPFDPDKPTELMMRPVKVNDHSVNALCYFAMLKPRYCGDAYAPKFETGLRIEGTENKTITLSNEDYRCI
jgi:hypothetical protein